MRFLMLCCVVCVVVGATLAQNTAASTTCDLNATPSNLGSQVAAAQPGQTVCLASGSYGTFTGAAKPGRVTVTAAPGASVDMSLDFNGASNITVAGMTIGTATIEGASHDITVSGSTFPPPGGAITVHPDQMNASSNIVIDRDTFNGQLCDQMSAQGRVAVEAIGNNNGNPLGLTISNNLFEGGTADGIRPDSGSGIQILNNQFISFDNSLNETCHTDAIQLYGSATHILFKGNFFYNSIDMAGCSFSEWNGGDFNTFEDNVVAGTPNNGCYDAIDLHSDNGSTIIHNTFAFGGCLPARNKTTPCGNVDLADDAGHGTVIRDNVMTGFSITGNPSYSEDHNLCHDTGCGGPGDRTGTPTFVGGAAPTTFAGFALASGSAGVGAASNGTNIGIELPTNGIASAGAPAGSGGDSRTGPARTVSGELVGVKMLAHTFGFGTAVIFKVRLTARAKVTIKLLRFIATRGHRSSRTRGRYKLVGTVKFSGKRGMNRLRIVKVRQHRLKLGRYRATVTAGHGSRRVTFTIERASLVGRMNPGGWARSAS